jgi:hypothetical protein
MAGHISNYPNGFAYGVNIRGVPLLNTYGGKVYWVDSGAGSNTNKGTFDRPFATIDYAIGRCAANNGDIIMVKPGHAETVSAAAGIDCDVAGITIIGLGNGEDRPTITFDTATTADMDIDAANITIQNLLFKVGVDSLAAMIDVNADDFTLIDCEYRENTSYQALTLVDINGGAANACDRAKIIRFKATQVTPGGNQAIELGEVADEVEIVDCVIDGDWANGGIHNPTGKVLTNLLIKDNIVANRQTGDHAIELVSACTGFAVDNRLYGDTLGTIFDPGSLKCLGNMEINAVDKPGIPSPLDVTDAATNFIGDDNNNNAAATTNVVANEDGSVLERLEQVQEATNKGTGTALAANESLVDVLYGTNGITTFPAAAAAADGVSIAEVVRYISELQVPRIVLKSTGDLTAFGTSKTLFTVTGDVLCRVGGSVNVAVTSTSGTTTLEVGVAGNTAALCVQDIVDGTAFAIGDSWTLVSPADANGGQLADEWLLVGNGADIILTGSVDDITAGDIDFYCQYIPLTSGASVVAA